MNRFASLLTYSPGGDPAAAQTKASSNFPRAVSQSRFGLRKPAAPIPKSGKLIIVGIACYIAEELQLLDELESSTHDNGQPPHRIEVFDVLKCQHMQDFDAFIPGMHEVFRSPVLGVIIDGNLVDKATGLSDVLNTLRRFQALDHHVPA